MRGQFTFTYGTELSEEMVAALNDVLDDPLTFADDGKLEYYRPSVGDLEDVLPIIGNKVRIEVTGGGDPRPLIELRDQLLDAVASLETRVLDKSDPQTYLNPRVDVHVPGFALLAIDDVEVHCDMCSDELQSYLDEGWRIVAVCPQPDQRRPDYVLGRAKGADSSPDGGVR